MIALQTAILLLIGLAYVLLIPLFDAPDEPQHFLRAYGIAEGQLILESHPKEIAAFYLDRLEERYPDLEASALSEARQKLDTYGRRIPNLAPNTSVYSFVPYVFHAGAIRLFSLLSDPLEHLGSLLYLCRMTTLLLFAACFGLSLWLAPQLAWPFFWLAATPMALAQAAVVSIDGMVLGCALVLLAAPLSRVQSRTFWPLAFCSIFFLVQAKFPYVPVVLLAGALVWAAGYEVRSRLLALGISFLLAFLLAGGWLAAAKLHGVDERLVAYLNEHLQPGIDPDEQLAWILHHPLGYLQLIAINLLSGFDRLLHQFVGVLGWLTIPLPWPYVWGWLAVSPLAVLLAGRMELGRKERWLIPGLSLLMSMACVVLILTSMYLICDPVGSPTINAQGRYFHVVAAMLLPGLTAGLSWRIERHWAVLSAVFILAALAVNGQMLRTLAAMT